MPSILPPIVLASSSSYRRGQHGSNPRWMPFIVHFSVVNGFARKRLMHFLPECLRIGMLSEGRQGRYMPLVCFLCPGAFLQILLILPAFPAVPFAASLRQPGGFRVQQVSQKPMSPTGTMKSLICIIPPFSKKISMFSIH